jgi:hypothetical protein
MQDTVYLIRPTPPLEQSVLDVDINRYNNVGVGSETLPDKSHF